jgi:hypothetical protein
MFKSLRRKPTDSLYLFEFVLFFYLKQFNVELDLIIFYLFLSSNGQDATLSQ